MSALLHIGLPLAGLAVLRWLRPKIDAKIAAACREDKEHDN